ncbi:MAG TPA: DoxX family protein [Lacunisphaera sp.]|nr:DoxX family protein [Lacunisphaera sp.]
MKIRALYEKFETFASWLPSPLLLVIRLYWGISFVQTGWGKLMHLDRTAAYFTDLGLPVPKVNAFMAGSTECFGGLLLALGLCARGAAVPLIFCMLVAYATADGEALRAIFSDPDKFTGATPFLFFYAALIVLAFGPGKLSLDTLVFRKAPKS